MIQCQYDPPSGQHLVMPRRDALLQRHPVLIPVALLSSSIALCIASLFADKLFPLLAWVGAPSALMCLLFAAVLGISGILTSIVSLLEHIDRYHLRADMFPKPKEGTSL